jgi:hypothetical protein
MNNEDRVGRKFAIRNLVEGDVVDLLELGEDYPFSESDRDSFQFECSVVIADGDNETPFVVESDQVWVLATTSGAYGVDPDWQLTVQERTKR